MVTLPHDTISGKIRAVNKFYAWNPNTPSWIIDNNVVSPIIKMDILNEKFGDGYSGHGSA